MGVNIDTDANEVLETKIVKEKLDTTNPFNVGVTYEAFMKNVNGKSTVDVLLKKANLSEAQTKMRQYVTARANQTVTPAF